MKQTTDSLSVSAYSFENNPPFLFSNKLCYPQVDDPAELAVGAFATSMHHRELAVLSERRELLEVCSGPSVARSSVAPAWISALATSTGPSRAVSRRAYPENRSQASATFARCSSIWGSTHRF